MLFSVLSRAPQLFQKLHFLNSMFESFQVRDVLIYRSSESNYISAQRGRGNSNRGSQRLQTLWRWYRQSEPFCLSVCSEPFLLLSGSGCSQPFHFPVWPHVGLVQRERERESVENPCLNIKHVCISPTQQPQDAWLAMNAPKPNISSPLSVNTSDIFCPLRHQPHPYSSLLRLKSTIKF